MAGRYLGIQEELTYGTPLSDALKFISIISESIAEDNQILEAETVEAREIVKARLGGFKAEGSFSIFAEPENIGWLLKAMFGTVADGGCASAQQGATAAYLHTFKPTVNGPRSYTVEIGSDVAAGARKYTSCLFKKMELSLAKGELVQGAFDITAKTLDLEALDSPTFSGLEPWVYHESYVKIGGSEDTDVEACKLTVENMWGTREALHSRFPVGKAIEGIKVGGVIDLAFDSLANYKRFLGGDALTAPAPQSYTRHALAIECIGPATGEDAYTYDLKAAIPEALFKTNKANLDKRSRMIQNLPFTAVYNASASHIIQMTLLNKVVSYADAA